MNTCVIGGSELDTVSVSFDPDSTLYITSITRGFHTDSLSLFYLYGGFSGSGEVGVDIDTIFDSEERGEAGLMMRSDTLTGSAFVSFSFSIEHGLLLRYRSSDGGAVSTLPVVNSPVTGLKVNRRGDIFDFYYTTPSSSGYIKSNSSYRIELGYNIYAGIFASSQGYDNKIETRVSEVNGFSVFESEEEDTRCEVLSFDFDTSASLSDLGFTGNGKWIIEDSCAVTLSDSTDAFMHSPEFEILRTNRAAELEWSMRLAQDTSGADSEQASLYGKNGIEIGDRSVIYGEVISSEGDIVTGHDSYIESDIESKSDIELIDRTLVKGSTSASGSIVFGSSVSVTGEIESGAETSTPEIKTKSFTTGTQDITVGNGDTISLDPGSYDEGLCRSESVVMLRSGVYNFRSFECQPDVRVVFRDSVNGRVVINTDERLSISDRCVFDFRDSIRASDIEVYSNQTNDLNIGSDVIVSGAMYLPYAGVRFMSRGIDIQGRVYAERITLEPDVDLTVTMPLISSRFNAGFSMRSGTDTSDEYTISFENDPESYDSLIQVSLIKNEDILADTLFRPELISSEWTDMEAIFRSGIDQDLPYGITIYCDMGGGSEEILSFTDSSITEFGRGEFGFGADDTAGILWGSLEIDNLSFSCVGGGCDSVVFMQEPEDVSVYEGSDVVFSAEALNEAEYQWYESDGSILSGENSPYLSLSDLSVSGDSGRGFYCIALNFCDTAVSDTGFVYVHSCTPPVITSHPEDQIAPEGGTALFTVAAEGIDLSYRWLINNEAVLTGDKDTLVYNDLKLYNTGDRIRVLVSNSCGWSVTSDPAELTVSGSSNCGITKGPVGDTLESGEYFITDVRTDCNESEFTWLRNGEVMENQAERELVFGSVDTTCSGDSFVCILDNGWVRDTSNTAYLHVVERKSTARLLSISGTLTLGSGTKARPGDTGAVEFYVTLYNKSLGGEPLYTEEFTGRKRVVVVDGEFTIQLGRGESEESLQRVLSSNNHLFAEIETGKNRESLGERIYLSGVPYSMSEGRRVMYGNGAPGEKQSDLPESTLYVDRDNSNATWIKTENTWVKLD
ncbi:MAG: hypothetical protein ACOCSE_00730 [Chitinivibrionales bacterium]